MLQTVILAGDEAFLYLQTTCTVVWAYRGQTPLIKLAPGRVSTHFYSALNQMTGRALAMPFPVMNAQVSALCLAKLLLAYPDRPILRLWDRATWHQGPDIQALLVANPRLEIMYFPAGAPDLNPQEHVWKMTRGAVSHSHTCQKLDLLPTAFETHLTSNTFASSLLESHGYLSLYMTFN